MTHTINYFVSWNENGERRNAELCSMEEAMRYAVDVVAKKENVAGIEIVKNEHFVF